MPDPVLSVCRVPVTQDMKTHPLATRSGISMLVHLIEAGKVWDGCTKPQRALLAELCRPVVETLLARDSLTAEDMPELPFKTSDRTREALRRRGLIDDRDRLTGCAIHAWFYAGRLKSNQAGVSAEAREEIAADVHAERTADADTRYREDTPDE